jgi:hypothetical protein
MTMQCVDFIANNAAGTSIKSADLAFAYNDGRISDSGRGDGLKKESHEERRNNETDACQTTALASVSSAGGGPTHQLAAPITFAEQPFEEQPMS